MSLDFDLTRIEDRKVHFPPDEQGKMNDTLHVLIWNMLAIDMGEIKESNVDEVWWRTSMWQRLIGAQFNQWVHADHPYVLVINSDGSASIDTIDVTESGEWQPFLLTREDIVHGIGLHTNVAPSTRHQFIKKVTGRFQP